MGGAYWSSSFIDSSLKSTLSTSWEEGAWPRWAGPGRGSRRLRGRHTTSSLQANLVNQEMEETGGALASIAVSGITVLFREEEDTAALYEVSLP